VLFLKFDAFAAASFFFRQAQINLRPLPCPDKSDSPRLFAPAIGFNNAPLLINRYADAFQIKFSAKPIQYILVFLVRIGAGTIYKVSVFFYGRVNIGQYAFLPLVAKVTLRLRSIRSWHAGLS
jgi:hypothetical protein